MRHRTWLFDQFREVSRLMAFEEVDFPVLESEALFIRKAGEEITQQVSSIFFLYLLFSSPSLLLFSRKSVSLPLKWFTIGQCWRYERMTRGRRREHYQWNMDIFGVPKVRAEAELLQAIVLLFQRLGITSSDVGIRVSSRKLGKLTREEIEKELMSTGLSSEAVRGIIEVLSLKSLSKLEEVLGSGVEAVADLKKLFSFAEQYDYADWICFDASVVRGLAYYTGIVFEAFDREGNLRAICGGGRYDRLLSTFGSEDIPACGFGFGDAVIVEHAERINASRLILVGNSEWERGMVRVKILSTREEFEVKAGELE
ncbi:hypothetical protein HU200_013360 [Digitaria exilis]|uniref:histidine--tRNA ligase n=1 Tax=Digitaria exilis TaxID=1010633 RepID=A0A835FDD3_9POAL|nr:hypothetical protein HU200_013360 [Digitaria exilis]